MMRVQKSVESETTSTDHHHFLHLTNKTDTHSQNFADFSVMEGSFGEPMEQPQRQRSSESLACDVHQGKKDKTLDTAGELVKAGYKEHAGEFEKVAKETNTSDFERVSEDVNQQQESDMVLHSLPHENHKLGEFSMEQNSEVECDGVVNEYGNRMQKDCDEDLYKNKLNFCGDLKEDSGRSVIERFDTYIKGKVDEEPGNINKSYYEDKLREKYKLGEENDQNYRQHRHFQYNGKTVQELKDINMAIENAKLPDVQPSPDFPDSDSNKGWGGGCPGEEGCDSDWDWERGRPTGERWPPLGAPNDDEDNLSLCSYSELSW